ncbi:MAG TPA: GGDEF domain-containing protein [Jatrophihabitans sp.]|nr:GGDEF domain-containing protein [Jatrophihabitans sp.]
MSRIRRGQRVSLAARVASWEIWTTPRALRAYVLGIETAVVLTAAALLVVNPWQRTSDLGRFGLLLLMAMGFEEISSRIAQLRAKLAIYSHVDMTSVWTFAAAVALPAALIAPLCSLVLFNAWLRHGRQSGIRPYRNIFAGAVVICASYAGRAAVTGLGSEAGSLPGSVGAVLTVLAGLICYFVINAAVVYTAIYLSVRPVPFRSVLNSWQDMSLEGATLCLGGLTALTLLQQPLLALLVVPPMFVLQSSVLTRQLEVAATTDAKTGLLNAATWHHVAGQELVRAEREQHSAALLIIDMDNFKLINDSYGHLAGDDVLRAVAECLVEELRGYDSIGRFGGEEFVAVLSAVDELAALTISERIRRRIFELQVPNRDPEQPDLGGLSASIGIACYPEHGTEVEGLLHAADSALYAAKRGGRNRVQMSISGAAGQPTDPNWRIVRP